MFCLSLEPNHYTFIKKLGYIPVGLGDKDFDSNWFRDISGKNISKKLMKKLVTSEIKKVYLALDKDAIKSTYKIAEQLLKLGKKLFIVELDDKDPSDMGFSLFTNKIQESKEFNFSSLFNLKLSL